LILRPRIIRKLSDIRLKSIRSWSDFYPKFFRGFYDEKSGAASGPGPGHDHGHRQAMMLATFTATGKRR
jgi:hypothetical protein